MFSEPSKLDTKQRAIVREPFFDETYRIFGIVSSEYKLVTPTEFCELWDHHVKAPIETLGALGYGETFFVSTKLPSFKVGGEDIDNYLIGVSPMTGKDAIQVMVTPVRVVCMNMLITAKRNASETCRVSHRGATVDELGRWLEHAWGKAHDKTEALKEAFSILAAKRINETAFNEIVALTYPEPRKPDARDLDVHSVSTRLAKWEQARDSIRQDRIEVGRLFSGAGKGSDSTAAKGTAWGLYNAVVEYEDYISLKASPERALFGYGAKIKERAFEEALAVARK